MGSFFGGANETTERVELPDYVVQGGKTAMDLAQAEAAKEYDPYTGQRVAPLNRGYGTAAAIASGLPGQRYQGYVNQGLGALGGLSQYAGPSVYLDRIRAGEAIGTPEWNSAAMQRYMSPYIQGALDPVAAEMRRSSAIEGQGNQDAFKQSGALGGSREAILEAERLRNTRRAVGDMYAQGLQNAYASAADLFSSDMARRQAGQIASGRQALGLAGMGANAASGLGPLAAQGAGLSYSDLEASQRAAAPYQSNAQAKADFDYQQYVEGRDWAGRNIGLLGNAATMPYESTRTTRKPGTSPFGQILGLGLSAAGMASGLGWAPFAAGAVGGGSQ